MADSKNTSKKPSKKQPDSDLFLTILTASGREALGKLMKEQVLDVGHIHPKKDSEEIEVHLYATKKQIDSLKDQGWQVEVGENLSEVGRNRQKEVGKGDRFKDGTIPPKGLGQKK
jgi:hypothetical protein